MVGIMLSSGLAGALQCLYTSNEGVETLLSSSVVWGVAIYIESSKLVHDVLVGDIRLDIHAAQFALCVFSSGYFD